MHRRLGNSYKLALYLNCAGLDWEPVGVDFAGGQASFAIADKHLADRAFVLGDKPTIADFSMAGYVYYPPEETGFDITTEFPALHAWRQRLAARWLDVRDTSDSD